MPTENKPVEPKLDYNTPEAGRSYIAQLFETVLRRQDYRQYINERLAGDFAWPSVTAMAVTAVGIFEAEKPVWTPRKAG